MGVSQFLRMPGDSGTCTADHRGVGAQVPQGAGTRGPQSPAETPGNPRLCFITVLSSFQSPDLVRQPLLGTWLQPEAKGSLHRGPFLQKAAVPTRHGDSPAQPHPCVPSQRLTADSMWPNVQNLRTPSHVNGTSTESQKAPITDKLPESGLEKEASETMKQQEASSSSGNCSPASKGPLAT